ncbi:Uncharacterised protein [Trueperella bialowiezensis]|uniref:Uncharacterized protein n=1 Tax=Trueperella bialowiezensis TaxID=312285 RepID=A0A3S4Z6G5_9ACTO|nr:Uncharacterised protein [Trueperella bialowiezensis]
MSNFSARQWNHSLLFLRIRRIHVILPATVLITIVAFAIMPSSYGIMALNGIRELEIYRALPCILGILCGVIVNPVASDQELLRGNRTRQYRVVLPFAVLAFSL